MNKIVIIFKNQVKEMKTLWEYGGTGRRAGFKIRSLRWCGYY